MNELENYAEKNSKFIKLEDGQSFRGTYIGYKIGADHFNPEKEIITYELKDKQGNQKFFKTGSVAVSRAIAKLEKGSPLFIKRHGQGMKTRYQISVEKSVVESDNLEPDNEIPF